MWFWFDHNCTVLFVNVTPHENDHLQFRALIRTAAYRLDMQDAWYDRAHRVLTTVNWPTTYVQV